MKVSRGVWGRSFIRFNWGQDLGGLRDKEAGF